ncbi:hypothetical protein [Mycobacterium sp.]|jgi:hypothetical protein|uniref:hypothetical protein n=1 Tax=Mycobacterium sp. TaxID=1785 RepID=UPI002D5EE3ED|nr:hypothetical protein [Mycobacterium sp.]HZA09924.1 hypothetical protein [Mycobacterium sp.]
MIAAMLAAALVVASPVASAGLASADPPAPPPQPKTTIDHDGTYSVGADIVPGTYVSAGPVAGGTCYWKRLSGPDGRDMIDNAMSKKPQAVRIDASDKAFKTDGCQPWQKTDDAKPPADIPPPIAGAQLHGYIDDLNGHARQFGGGQLPQP